MARSSTKPLDANSKAKLTEILDSREPDDESGTEAEDVPFTQFPWLDILDHASESPSFDGAASGSEKATQNVPLNQKIPGLPSSSHILSLLQGYGSFILDLTGEEAILFLCTIAVPETGTASWEGVVLARFTEQPNGQGPEQNFELKTYNRASGRYARAASVTKFALEISSSTKAQNPTGRLPNVGDVLFQILQ